jgi:hypothetical protein
MDAFYSSFLPFAWIAVIVGVIVSIDVTGLVLSQCEGYGKEILLPKRQALLHAGWHAGLFFLYILGIMGLLSVVDECARVLKRLFELVDRFIQFLIWDLNLPFPDFNLGEMNVAGFATDMALLVGILIIVFVWLTYSSKIAENHKEKYGEEPDAELRFDVKLLVRAISRLPFVRRSAQHVLAAAVAVDMLAVSALIKSYLIPDAVNPVARLQVFDSIFLSVLLFAAFVFLAVYLVALLAGLLSKWIGERKPKGLFVWVLVLLRIAEPFLIFFFLAGAIESLVSPTIERSDDDILALLSETFVSGEHAWLSAVLTLSLVLFAGPRQIIAHVKSGIHYSERRKNQTQRKESLIAMVWRHSWPLLVSLCIAMLIVAAANTEAFGSPHNLTAVVRFVGLSMGVLATILAIAFYFWWLFSGKHGQRARASARTIDFLSRFPIVFLTKGSPSQPDDNETTRIEEMSLPESIFVLEAHHKILLSACGLMLMAITVGYFADHVVEKIGGNSYAAQAVMALMSYPFLLGAALAGLAWLADPRPRLLRDMEPDFQPLFTVSNAFACLSIPAGLVLILETMGQGKGVIAAMLLFVLVLASCLMVELQRARRGNRD